MLPGATSGGGALHSPTGSRWEDGHCKQSSALGVDDDGPSMRERKWLLRTGRDVTHALTGQSG
jgi:hypothetical protein